MGEYLAPFKKQLRGTPCSGYNCNMGAAAMMAGQYSLGLIDKTADDLRALVGDGERCTDPNHKDDGTSMQNAAVALAKLGVHITVYDYSDNVAFSTVEAFLRAGRSIVAHGDYDSVPTKLKGDKKFLQGRHSEFWPGLANADNVRVGDPLNDGRRFGIPKGYVEYPLAVAKRYLEEFPGKGYTIGVMDVRLLTSRVPSANIRRGTSVGTPIVATLTPNQKLRWGGVVLGTAVGGDRRWYRVWVPAVSSIGYIHASVMKPA